MACNPDPEVLAPMRVMQRPKQKAKRNEKLAKTVRETSTSTRAKRAKEGFLFHAMEFVRMIMPISRQIKEKNRQVTSCSLAKTGKKISYVMERAGSCSFHRDKNKALLTDVT